MENINLENKKNNKNKIKAVIFDFDDTLVKTMEESVKRHRKAAKKAGFAFDEKKYLELYGGPWPDMLSDIFGYNTNEFLRIYFDLGPFKAGVIEGIEESIRKLASKDVLMGILSSGTKEFVVKRLKEEVKCPDLFDSNIIMSKEDTKEHKPSKEAFTGILGYLGSKGITREEIVYCGDLLVDMEAANNAGLGFIAVAATQKRRDIFIRAGLKKNRIIESAALLPNKLEELGI